MSDLTLTRTLGASPERVWRAWTTDELVAWLWPSSWAATCEIDLRVGGRFRISSSTVDTGAGGEYTVVEAITRLQHTWLWEGDEKETLVTLTFEPVDGGTLLTIVHENFADDATRDDHLQGWGDCVDRLPGFLASDQ